MIIERGSKITVCIMFWSQTTFHRVCDYHTSKCSIVFFDNLILFIFFEATSLPNPEEGGQVKSPVNICSLSWEVMLCYSVMLWNQRYIFLVNR